MKHSFTLMALAMVSFAACTSIEKAPESVPVQVKQVVFSASREGINPLTRSVRQSDGSIWWNPSEEISVFCGSGTDGGSKMISMNTADAASADFSGSVSGSGSEYWAVYPYSEENSFDGTAVTMVIPWDQTAVEENFSGGVFPAVAKSQSTVMAFRNVCGGVRFSVSRSDITSVSFMGNHGEPLAGKVKVTFGSDGNPVVSEVLEPECEVKLSAPGGGTFKPGKYYYFTLLPAALESGMTMIFSTSTLDGTASSAKPQNVKRSVFGVLTDADSNAGEWRDPAEPRAVDLGLSVEWASFNVGASAPEDFGDYFAWGDPEPYYEPGTLQSSEPVWKPGKETGYNYQSYIWQDRTGFTKYNFRINAGTLDYKRVLDPEDDAACLNWGGDWRTPARVEVEELIDTDHCVWTWTAKRGVKGYWVNGSKSGYKDKFIFLPAAGWCSQTYLVTTWGWGNYWSSTLYISSTSSGSVNTLSFNSNSVGFSNVDRQIGYPVRPVYGEFVHVSSVSLDKSEAVVDCFSSLQLTATVSPSNATEASVYWVSGDTVTATVNQNGLVQALAPGETNIYVYAANGLSASFKITIMDLDYEPEVAEAVDLGLSVKWASFNMGASAPEEIGDFFAWGETRPYYAPGYALSDNPVWRSGYSSGYSPNSYKWSIIKPNESIRFSKYCTNSEFGIVDGKTVLDPEDDAATVRWGGDWRMPTREEMEELLNPENCTCVYETRNGVSGLLVTSNKEGFTDKSIFIPASGYRSGRSRRSLAEFVYLWTSSLCPEERGESYYLFHADTWGHCGTYPRYDGLPIRPVCPKE